MKLLKKIACYIVAMTICVSMFPVNYSYAAETLNNQEIAYIAYLSLSDNLGIRMDTFSENYGGCYIDNDILVVLLTC